MVNAKNIKPHEFKSGNEWQGNRSGRPPGKSLSTLIKEKLEGENYVILKGELMDQGKRTGKTVSVRIKLASKDLILNAIISKASKGNIQAASLLFDRLEGRPAINVDLGIEKMQGKYIEPPEPPKEIEAKKDDVKG